MSSFPIWDLQQIENEIANRGGYDPAPANLEAVVRGEDSPMTHLVTEDEAELAKARDVAVTVASPGWKRIQKNLDDIAKEAEKEFKDLYESAAPEKDILAALAKAKHFRLMYQRHIREIMTAVEQAKAEQYI